MLADKDVTEKIRDFILKRAGLYFKEHDMPSLRENIARRMAAITCPTRWGYYKVLTESPHAHKEFTELLNLLTIKHTHFFRNKDQFIGLRDEVLPEIMKRKAEAGDLTLNILSAGCATGEEPYSIGMILLEQLGQATPWRLWVLATDISTEALVAAKKGIYSRRALLHIDKDFIEQYMEKYCLIHEEKVFVSPAVKNMIEFQYMNLIDEFYPMGFDIIFCRNVAIYFETATVKRVMEKFCESLNEEGYLFTGGTEIMHRITDNFKLIDVGNALVYKKIPAKELRSTEKSVWPWQPVVTPTVKEEAAPVPEVVPVPEAAPVPKPVEKKPVEPAKSLKNAHELYKEAKEDFIKKDYETAERLAKDALENEPVFQEAHILLANIYVNQDKFEEAKKECLKAININFLAAEPRYLLGLIHKKNAQYHDALDNLRRAVYLNTNYSLAYFTTAELYRERGLTEKALKAYRNTLKALEQEPEEHFRESSGGLAKKVLAQACVRGMKEVSQAK